MSVLMLPTQSPPPEPEGENPPLQPLQPSKETVPSEVLRIKEVLKNLQDESDLVLYESLRRLQLMQLTIDILKAIEIGKTVNSIRRDGEKSIRHLARALIE